MRAMALWDNRSVLHQVATDYDMEEHRYLYRLLLEGEVPVHGSQPRRLAGACITGACLTDRTADASFHVPNASPMCEVP